MTWRFAALPLIFLLPGYLTLHLPLWGKTSNTETTFGQRFFLSLLISVLISGLIGLVLAQAGVFSLGSFLLALAVYSVFCLAFIAASGRTRRQGDKGTRRPSPCLPLSVSPPLRSVRFDWEDAIVIFLLGLSLWLYARPAEYILGWLDAGWYVNTGVRIAKTGSLTGESQVFSSLPSAAKPLFYSSFASLKKLFPYFPDTESRGIYLWSFAVSDPEGGQVTAYHPPLFSIWIAIFYALGGLRFGLYATPFLGALSVLSLYFAGQAMFGRKVGLLAAVLLTISFTQIYFSRTPYSEILGQLLLFSGIYALTTWTVSHSVIASKAKQSPDFNHKQQSGGLLRHFVPRNDKPSSYIVERKSLYAAIAALSFGQAALSRIEGVVVVLPLVMFFGCWLISKRSLPKDFRFFVIPFGLLLVDGVALALTVSRPYVELNSYGLWVKLRPLLTQSPTWLVMSVILLGGLFVLSSESAKRRIYEGRHLIMTLLSLVILLLAIYAYFIPKDGTFARLGKFISPLGFWLGMFGLVELIRRGVNEKTAFFLALALIHGLASISVLAMSTTSSYIYPIRRQVPMFIPSLIMLASYAILIWNGGGKLLRAAQLVAVGILLVSLLALDMPYVNYREMSNTIAFSEKLANHFGEQDVVVFEETWFQDSRVGHFAAPLWSIYDKNALLISTANVEDAVFSTAVAQWLESGKGVYFVSQSDPPLISLAGYELLPVAEERWLYSTITAKSVFPPEIREFEIPFYIYQIV